MTSIMTLLDPKVDLETRLEEVIRNSELTYKSLEKYLLFQRQR